VHRSTDAVGMSHWRSARMARRSRSTSSSSLDEIGDAGADAAVLRELAGRRVEPGAGAAGDSDTLFLILARGMEAGGPRPAIPLSGWSGGSVYDSPVRLSRTRHECLAETL
jgi:hypothetical protein